MLTRLNDEPNIAFKTCRCGDSMKICAEITDGKVYDECHGWRYFPDQHDRYERIVIPMHQSWSPGPRAQSPEHPEEILI